MSRRTVTVFGASGFIGRHVVQRLAAEGAIVRACVTDPEAAMFLKPMGDIGQIVFYKTDIRNRSSVDVALKGADEAVNLVGILSEWGKKTFENVHVEGARNIAEAAVEAGVKRLVHVSSQAADPQSPSTYARTKAAGEDAVKAAYDDATILRPCVVMGAEDHFFNMFAGMSRLSPVLPVFGCPLIPKVVLFPEGKPFEIDLYGEGGTRMQPVFVGDVAEAVTTALRSGSSRGQTYELGGPTTYSFKEIMDLLLKYTDRRRFLAPVPFGIASFMAWFTEKLPNPVLTRDQVTLLKRDATVREGSLGFSDLGLSPTPAETVLPTYLGRFRPNRYAMYAKPN